MINYDNISKKLFAFEREILPQGCGLVAGMDEAGRGPLAGPVVAAAVILPLGAPIDGVFDSKALTPAKREKVFLKITNRAIDIGIGLVGQDLIDRINILQSTIQAMCKALNKLIIKPEFVLIDALSIPEAGNIPQKAVIKGDQKCYSIAAASIVAKVVRDRLMSKFHYRYPEYNFERNKGYGTPEHLKALATVGPCPLHRRSFKRVKEFCLIENSS